jgi:hypothetical protein
MLIFASAQHSALLVNAAAAAGSGEPQKKSDSLFLLSDFP